MFYSIKCQRWGITYREDKDKVVSEIKKLVDSGEYPKGVWE